MTVVRILGPAAFIAAIVAACSSPTQQERVESSELARLAPLKQRYPGVVMGFDVRPETTLIVSLDLQHYIEMDDDAAEALKIQALEAWRSAWAYAHPRAHTVLRVRLIDFIGRKIAEETAVE
jgi:hypothetical protein